MSDCLRISNVRVVAASPEVAGGGLDGFVSCVLNDSIRIDGLVLRTTREGRRTLAFPARRDRRGNDHPVVQPLSNEVRLKIEAQVFDALGIGKDER